MKTIFCCIIFLPSLLFAQIDLVNIRLTDTTQAILYKGIENKIKITGIANFNGIHLISSVCDTSTKWEKAGSYGVYCKSGKKDTLRLITGNGEEIFSKVFNVDKIPNPEVQLGGIDDTVATVEEIIADPQLRIVLKNCYFNHNCIIAQYSLKIVRKNSPTLLYSTKGYRLAPYQLNFIKFMKSGDKLVFSKMTNRCPDCAIRSFEPVVIHIK